MSVVLAVPFTPQHCTVMEAVALYDFQKSSEDELTFSKGSVIKVSRRLLTGLPCVYVSEGCCGMLCGGYILVWAYSCFVSNTDHKVAYVN